MRPNINLRLLGPGSGRPPVRTGGYNEFIQHEFELSKGRQNQTRVGSQTQATAERAAGNRNVTVDQEARINNNTFGANRAFTANEAAMNGVPGLTGFGVLDDVMAALKAEGVNVEALPREVLEHPQETVFFKPKMIDGKVRARFAIEMKATETSEGGTVIYEIGPEGCKIVGTEPAGTKLQFANDDIFAYREPGANAFHCRPGVKPSPANATVEDQAAAANQKSVANWRQEALQYVKEHPGVTTGGVLGAGGLGTAIVKAIDYFTDDDDAAVADPSRLVDPNLPSDPSSTGGLDPSQMPSQPVDLDGLVYDPTTGTYAPTAPAYSRAQTPGGPLYVADPTQFEQAQQSLRYYGRSDQLHNLQFAAAEQATATAAANLTDRITKYASLVWNNDMNDKLTASLSNDMGRFIATLPATRRRDLVTLLIICILGGDAGKIVDHDSDFDLYKAVTARLANPSSVNGSLSFAEARQLADVILSRVLLD